MQLVIVSHTKGTWCQATYFPPLTSKWIYYGYIFMTACVILSPKSGVQSLSCSHNDYLQ